MVNDGVRCMHGEVWCKVVKDGVGGEGWCRGSLLDWSRVVVQVIS